MEFQQPTANSEPVPQSWLLRLVKRVALYAVRAAAVFVVATAAFIVFSQTQVFRDWLRNRGVELLNEQIQGQVVIDDIQVSLFRGIVIEHPRLYANGTTVLDAKRLTVNYDPASLFVRVAAITNLKLEEPAIAIVRSTDGVWNVERIAKPPADTARSEPPRGTVVVKRLRISDGTISVDDQTTLRTDSIFDPMHVALTDVRLDMGLRVNLHSHHASIAVNGLSCRDNRGGPLAVTMLQCIVLLSPQGLNVPLLRLQMPRTQIDLKASVQDVDFMAGLSDDVLVHHPLRATVKGHLVHGPDLHYFIPEVNMADDYSLDADVEYTGNSVHVTNMNLEAGATRLRGAVRVDELYGRKPLTLDIALFNSVAQYSDVRRRLVFVPLPELPFLQFTTLDTLLLRGRPDSILTITVRGADKPGAVAGDVALDLSKSELGYAADLRVTAGDVTAFVPLEEPVLLNGTVRVEGIGVNPRTMQAKASVALENSVILGRSVRRLNTEIRSDGSGVYTIDTLYAGFTSENNHSATPDQTNFQELLVVGTLNLADIEHPIYSAQIATKALDLERTLRVQGLPQRLTTQFTVHAEGFHIDSLRGTVGGTVSEMVLDDRAFLPFSLSMSASRSEHHSSLRLYTDFANILLEGRFVPSSLIEAVSASANAVLRTSEHIAQNFVPASDVTRQTGTKLLESDVLLQATIKDFSVLNILLPDTYVSGSGVLHSRLTVLDDHVQFLVDTLRTDQVHVSNAGGDIIIDPVVANGNIDFDEFSTLPHIHEATFSATIDSVLNISGLTITQPVLQFHHNGTGITFSARSAINTVGITVAGEITPHTDATVIRLDSAHVVVDSVRKLEWGITMPALATVSKGVVNIEKLVVQRPWRETVSLSGILSDSIFHGLTVRIENFPLTDVPRFVELEANHPLRLADGLVTELVALIDGTWTKPEINASLNISNLSYNRAIIGDLSSKLYHKNKTVRGIATVTSAAGTETYQALNLDIGSIPFDAAFTSVAQRIDESKPWDIALMANNLSLAVAEPFLPAVERVRGKADARITASGPGLNDIKLQGAARYSDGFFLASATNIGYESEGWVSLEGNELRLDTILVRNRTKDLRGGMARAQGVVVFKGLNVDRIDFTVVTEGKRGLMVMNSSSQARSPNVYGDLIIGSGRDPIRLSGRPDRPSLSGDIMVYYSDLTYPKERSATRATVSSVEYVRPTDGHAQSLADIVQTKRRKPDEDSAATAQSATEATANAVKQVVQTMSPSFVDIIKYNLKIYLRGRTLITMNLGTFEILVADLELEDPDEPLTFTGKFADNSTDLRGTLRLREGASTYKFYKPFRTGGLLKFSQGAGITNPALALTAVYQDRRLVGDNKFEEYKVELTITGTKNKPKVAYRVWRNDREAVGDSAKIASDALMLILLGRTSDELLSSGQGDLVGQVNSAFSAVATSALSDVVSELGFVQNAQVDFGSDLSQSRLTLSGQLFGDVSYRVSGQFSDFSGNSTFTVSIPLSILSDAEAMRLFQADVSHSVNNSGNISRQTRLWEIRLGARIQ